MNKADSILRGQADDDGYSESMKSHKKKEDMNTNKLRRRSKKDKVGRNYICGCGKKYLSYPALYTHIKTKHDGVHPEGTKQCTNSKTKRGRPKKYDFREDDKTSILESHMMGDMNNPNNPNSEFIHILSEGFSASDLSVLRTLDPSCAGKCDPKAFFNRFLKMKLNIKFKNKGGMHPFLQIFEKIENGENLLSKPNCDFVFALFLFHVSKIVSSKFYNILAIFFSHLRECINCFGYSVIPENKSKNQNTLSMELFNNGLEGYGKKEEYCEHENPEDIPYIANFFVLVYLPKQSKLFDQDLAVRIMVDFMKFLNKNNFSKKKLVFDQSNLDETVTFRDIFEKNL